MRGSNLPRPAISPLSHLHLLCITHRSVSLIRLNYLSESSIQCPSPSSLNPTDNGARNAEPCNGILPRPFTTSDTPQIPRVAAPLRNRKTFPNIHQHSPFCQGQTHYKPGPRIRPDTHHRCPYSSIQANFRWERFQVL